MNTLIKKITYLVSYFYEDTSMSSLRGGNACEAIQKKTGLPRSRWSLAMTLTSYKITLILLLCLSSLIFWNCSGATGSTPSTDIPAPVSHLSVSSPDSDGLVRITAQAGFTDANSTVTIVNPNAGTNTSLLDLFISRAFAHETHTLTSNADGSFQNSIEGSVGDILTITYVINGSTTSVNQVVPANTPPLPLTSNIQDVSIDPNTNQVLVVANDGFDGFVYVISTSQSQVINTIPLPGASGANRIATDPTTGETIVLDTINNIAWHITLDGGGSVVSLTDIPASSDVAASINGGQVIISHTNVAPALSVFDLATDTALATATAQNQDGENQINSFFVVLGSNGANEEVGLLSLMPNDILFLTTHLLDPVAPSLSQNRAISLASITNPGGLTLFNNLTEALVTDTDNNLLYRIELADGSTTTITVGSQPQGVIVDDNAGIAYVVNSEDRTLSLIDLTSNTVTSTTEIGLTPAQIAQDPSQSVEIKAVVNTGDETVTLLE